MTDDPRYGLKAQRGYEKAYTALFSAETLAEAKRIFGTQRASNILWIAVKHPDLEARYRTLVQRDSVYSRAKRAMDGAESLSDARQRYGATKPSALRTAVRRYPDLVELYDSLPGAGQSAGVAKANERHMQAAEERRAILIEDVEMLLSAGESRDEIVRRVGKKSWNTLERALERADRRDLIARIQRR